MKDYLDSIADYLKAHPKSQMIILGGIDQKNIDNSDRPAQEKANELAAYLINQGVSPNRIVARNESSNKHIPPESNFNFKKRHLNNHSSLYSEKNSIVNF